MYGSSSCLIFGPRASAGARVGQFGSVGSTSGLG